MTVARRALCDTLPLVLRVVLPVVAAAGTLLEVELDAAALLLWVQIDEHRVRAAAVSDRLVEVGKGLGDVGLVACDPVRAGFCVGADIDDNQTLETLETLGMAARV